MFYHVITNITCNLSCKYCDKEAFEPLDEGKYDLCMPKEISYPVEELQEVVSEEDYLTFYGGEPLMSIPKVREIMDKVKCKGFMIQTNGLLLDQLGEEYTKKFQTMLVSIDGDEESTDRNRGKGVHAKVMKNLGLVKQSFNGELIARMTISESSSLYKQVLWLLENEFENVHWQLDVLFDKEEDTRWLDNYNEEVSNLIEYWIGKMREGKVVRLYPFLVLMDSLLRKESSPLRCGSGHSNYTIMTNRKVIPCPIMNGFKEYYVGEIPSKSFKKVEFGEPCKSCDILSFCGGRCLFANLEKNWSSESYAKACGTVRHLKQELERILPEVEELISKGIISLEDFKHLKYNGVEVVP